MEYPGAKPIEYREIIMYRTFYPLLEEIHPDCLLVFNECLRTQNRSDLTYNCAHHYCNQTPHKIVFEHFPFIEARDDFMILLDFLDKGRYKGKGFSWEFLREQDVRAVRHPLAAEAISIALGPKLRQKYQAKKDQLFAELTEEQDPDIIPRHLHVLAGDFKKGGIAADRLHVARNARFKMENVVTYKEAEPGKEYTIIDFPHRRLDFCDFVKTTGQRRFRFIHSGLPVDDFYFSELTAWIGRLEEFYAQTDLY
ncbi:MAG: hypothetical protein GXY24_03665 [Bacteroidales bacterium]|nr:hypothetical protein [Bacteroidales bacterium]